MSHTVFVTAPKLHPAGVAVLEQHGARILYLSQPDSAEEVERTMAAEPVDAVISRTAPLSAAAIAACPSLKVISKHGVGVSNIDVAAATARRVPVYVTPGANAASVAEMAIGLMIAAARRIPLMDRALRSGQWRRLQDGRQLNGATLGLLGYGQIGQCVARAARALGMRVLAHDPSFPAPNPVPDVERVDSLDALLSRSDVLSLHVPLNAATRGLLDSKRLAALPAGAILVNTARGEVVDEAALVEALRSGRLHSAGLDTMVIEPLPADSPLLTLENVVLTPHVGGSTPAALAGMAEGAARNVMGMLTGDAPGVERCVNPQVFR
ncbi:hydroxyacid dehydrogenase [Achromobacter sp. RTa]|uniref:hydroxyacid dehydrogenase n=1 Tax=Achromobacter sp. RTa TaxID=1532557 RepID=UPI00050DC008|nr:hydroxyacid dehydrogenase [Achromobacter sp. RTa]KGD96798.1 hydroxyacid dehydrogenase [Achromobacter sp. RTa]